MIDSLPNTAFLSAFGNVLELSDIAPALPPVASFTYNPHSGTKPLTVAFSGSGTNGPILEWAWDFADATQDASQNPSHEFAEHGTYGVSLQTRNAGGWSNIVSHDVVVTDPDAPPSSNRPRHFGGSRLRAPRQRTRG